MPKYSPPKAPGAKPTREAMIETADDTGRKEKRSEIVGWEDVGCQWVIWNIHAKTNGFSSNMTTHQGLCCFDDENAINLLSLMVVELVDQKDKKHSTIQ
jgi:hypothetical protein